MTDTVWVTTGFTESGDKIDPVVWSREPSDFVVDSYLRAKYPEEFQAEGPGLIHNWTYALPVTDVDQWKNV